MMSVRTAIRSALSSAIAIETTITAKPTTTPTAPTARRGIGSEMNHQPPATARNSPTSPSATLTPLRNRIAATATTSATAATNATIASSRRRAETGGDRHEGCSCSSSSARMASSAVSMLG